MLDGAVGLVSVGAVWKSAEVGDRPQVAKRCRNLGRHKFPQLELPHAWRINEESAAAMRDQSGRSGGVAALIVVSADIGHGQRQLRLERVEDRRFPNAALSHNCGDAACDQPLQPSHSAACNRRTEHNGIAHACVDACQRHEAGRID